MTKTRSRILIVTGALVLVIAVAVAVVLGQLGRLVKRGVETAGPVITGTGVTLSSARISLFSGEGALNRLRIENPKGFSTDYAFDLGRIAVAVDTQSVTGDVVRIRTVEIDGPKLIAEFDAAGRNNLMAILDHVKSQAGKTSGGSEPPDGTQTRMIIERFRFTNAEVRALAEPFKLDKTLKLPMIELKNLGGKGGATAAEISSQVLRPVVEAAIKAARNEYLKAKRGELEQKAKEKLLDKVFN